MRADLYRNIVLGGVTDTTVAANVQKNVQAKAKPATANVHVDKLPENPYTAFNGASILVCLSSFQSSWVTANEYAEQGAAVVLKKKLNWDDLFLLAKCLHVDTHQKNVM